jgi:hypothetical protein
VDATVPATDAPPASDKDAPTTPIIGKAFRRFGLVCRIVSLPIFLECKSWSPTARILRLAPAPFKANPHVDWAIPPGGRTAASERVIGERPFTKHASRIVGVVNDIVAACPSETSLEQLGALRLLVESSPRRVRSCTFSAPPLFRPKGAPFQ